MRSVSRNPPMQLKEAVSTATITNPVIRGERFLESRTKAPRIVIEEMALVALIKGVCNKGGTLETKKYPTPRREKKIPSIMMRGNNVTPPSSSLFSHCFQGAPMQDFTLVSNKSLFVDFIF